MRSNPSLPDGRRTVGAGTLLTTKHDGATADKPCLAIVGNPLLPGEEVTVSLAWDEDIASVTAALVTGDQDIVVLPRDEEGELSQGANIAMLAEITGTRADHDGTPGDVQVLGIRRVLVVDYLRKRPNREVVIRPLAAPEPPSRELRAQAERLRVRINRYLAHAGHPREVEVGPDLQDFADRMPLVLRWQWRDRLQMLAADLLAARLELIDRWLTRARRQERAKFARRPQRTARKATPEGPAPLPPAIAQRLEESKDRDGLYGHSREEVKCVTEMVWVAPPRGAIDLIEAKRLLDESHAGMAQVKDAVLDFLASEEWRRRMDRPNKGYVLCLVGPPGTGKTSIASVIAAASGRLLERIPMAGVDDVFLQGCDQAYNHARPGEIVRRLRRNHQHPSQILFLLDEVDKIIDREQRTVLPSLLSMLDPVQNSGWQDQFLDAYSLDLSGTLFVCTANDDQAIPTPLRDRLQLVTLPAYTADEQVRIGRDFVLPRALEDAGISTEVILDDEVVGELVAALPTTPGMRHLEGALRTVIGRALREHLVTGVPIFIDGRQALEWVRDRGSTPRRIGFRAGQPPARRPDRMRHKWSGPERRSARRRRLLEQPPVPEAEPGRG